MQRKLRKPFRGNRFQKLPETGVPRFCMPPWGNDMVLSLHPKTFCHPTLKNICHPTIKNILPPHPRNCFAILHPKGLFASPLLQFVCHLNHQQYFCQPSPPKNLCHPTPKIFCHLTPKNVVTHSHPKFPCLTFNFCG